MPKLRDFFKATKKWHGKGYWVVMLFFYKKKKFKFVMTIFHPLEKMQERLDFWFDLIGFPSRIVKISMVSKKYVPAIKKALKREEGLRRKS